MLTTEKNIAPGPSQANHRNLATGPYRAQILEQELRKSFYTTSYIIPDLGNNFAIFVKSVPCSWWCMD